MKKISFVFIFIFVCAIFTYGQTAIFLDQALDNCVAQFKNQLPKGGRVAVLKIDSKSDSLTEYVTDNLSAKIVAQKHFTVVERGKTLSALEAEQIYQMSGNVSDETATSIGKQLGAEMVITGSISSRGDLYSLNIRIVQVETTRIQNQYTVNNVKLDPSIAAMTMPSITAVARFTGTNLDSDDQAALVQDIHQALVQYNVPIEIVLPEDAPSGADYSFLITFRVNQRPALVAADLTVALRKGTRVLKQSTRQSFSELNLEWLVRKGGQLIRADKEFFQALPGIIAQQ